MKKMGRPSLYSDAIALRAIELAVSGKTDVQIAESLKIPPLTFIGWKERHPDFALALKRAKDVADDEVERTLRERALGYSHKAIKFFCHEGVIISEEYIEHYPPDTGACIFWLKNRRPERWREKQRDEELDDFKRMTLNELILAVGPKLKELEAKK